MGASFTVGASPAWGEFFEFGFPFVEVLVEGCRVRLVLLVTGFGERGCWCQCQCCRRLEEVGLGAGWRTAAWFFFVGWLVLVR